MNALLNKDNMKQALRQYCHEENQGLTKNEENKLLTDFYYTNNSNSLNTFDKKACMYFSKNIPYKRCIKVLKELDILVLNEAEYEIYAPDKDKSLACILGEYSGLKNLEEEIFYPWRRVNQKKDDGFLAHETEVVKYLAGREVYEYYSSIEDLKPEQMPEHFKEYYAPYLKHINKPLNEALKYSNKAGIMADYIFKIPYNMTNGQELLIKAEEDYSVKELSELLGAYSGLEILEKEIFPTWNALIKSNNHPLSAYESSLVMYLAGRAVTEPLEKKNIALTERLIISSFKEKYDSYLNKVNTTLGKLIL